MIKTNFKVVKADRNGDCFDRIEVAKVAVNIINNENYFSGNRRMNEECKDVQMAQAKLNTMLDSTMTSIDCLRAAEKKLGEQAKSVGGNVRDAAEKLSQGLARVEKAADFNRLEKYVDLLERAAAAMSVLGDLEKSGRLEKIASAIR